MERHAFPKGLDTGRCPAAGRQTPRMPAIHGRPPYGLAFGAPPICSRQIG